MYRKEDKPEASSMMNFAGEDCNWYPSQENYPDVPFVSTCSRPQNMMGNHILTSKTMD